MQYKQFEIVVTEVPFIDDRTQSKVRPVVVISSDEYNKHTGFIVVAMITSAKHSKLWNDIAITDPEAIGLKEPSIIRMKFTNILASEVLAKIGTLDNKNQSALQEKVKVCFGV
jgi:mRNA interferase MazF